ncbi:MAG: hypothetical protein ACFE8E_06415 [Candidatus Hodarchaeota archaeon]
MYYCGDYDDLLEDSLIEELEWLREEFELLFKFKRQHPSIKDKQLANQMIEIIVNRMKFSDDKRINEILIEAIEKIEYNFPELF